MRGFMIMSGHLRSAGPAYIHENTRHWPNAAVLFGQSRRLSPELTQNWLNASRLLRLPTRVLQVGHRGTAKYRSYQFSWIFHGFSI